MINENIVSHMVNPITKLMIPADNVAHVFDSNTLNHAMLILSTVKYSVIPVLSVKSKLLGLINMPLMINAVTTEDSIEIDKLDQIFIRDVMINNPVTIKEDASFEKILHHLVDQNFLCVVDDQDEFKGIITRREMLKRINHFLHDISIPDNFEKLFSEVMNSEKVNDAI